MYDITWSLTWRRERLNVHPHNIHCGHHTEDVVTYDYTKNGFLEHSAGILKYNTDTHPSFKNDFVLFWVKRSHILLLNGRKVVHCAQQKGCCQRQEENSNLLSQMYFHVFAVYSRQQILKWSPYSGFTPCSADARKASTCVLVPRSNYVLYFYPSALFECSNVLLHVVLVVCLTDLQSHIRQCRVPHQDRSKVLWTL